MMYTHLQLQVALPAVIVMWVDQVTPDSHYYYYYLFGIKHNKHDTIYKTEHYQWNMPGHEKVN